MAKSISKRLDSYVYFLLRVAELISVAFSWQGILILTEAGVPDLSHS